MSQLGRRKINRTAIHDLIRAGISHREIARRVGCTERTVLRAAHEIGAARPAPLAGRRITDQDVEKITALLDEGWSYEEIKRSHHYSLHTLYRVAPGRAWTPQQAGALGGAVRSARLKEARA